MSPRRGQKPKPATTPLGVWIDAIVEGRGISHAAFARALGQEHGSSVNRWRLGKTDPSTSTLQQIAKAFPEYAHLAPKPAVGDALAPSGSPAMLPAQPGGNVVGIDPTALGNVLAALRRIKDPEKQIEASHVWYADTMDPHWLSGDNTGEPHRSAHHRGAP